MTNKYNFSRHLICILSVIFILSSIMVTSYYIENAYGLTHEVVKETKNSANSTNMKWAFISAALATGMSTIGAAIAVGLVGSSAMGAISEKPEMAGRALIFVGLAEGIAIYGLIVAIMILGMI